MIARSYKLEAFWGGRDETLLAEAARLASFLSTVDDCLEVAQPWFVARDTALVPLAVDEPALALARVLELQFRSWTYAERVLTEHSVELSNARDKPYSLQLKFACGLPKCEVGIWFANRLELELWAPRAGLKKREALDAIFTAACVQLAPTWACLGPPNFPLRDLEEKFLGIPNVSWMTYLSNGCPAPEVLPASVSWERVPETGGMILRVDPEWFDVNNRSHCEEVEQLRKALEAQSALPAATRVPT